jgi:hypothetical protein
MVPVSEYYKGKGTSVMRSMMKQYGTKKGREVFYRTANKKKMGIKDHLVGMKSKGQLK